VETPRVGEAAADGGNTAGEERRLPGLHDVQDSREVSYPR